MLGGGPQVIGIKLVEPSAAQVQLLSGGRGRQFIAPKSSKDFTDQGCAQTVRELAIVFFIVAKMREWQPNNESAIPALRAFRRPPLRSGLLQARRAGRVRLCSHTCPGLNAHCSPLLATQHSEIQKWPDTSCFTTSPVSRPAVGTPLWHWRSRQGHLDPESHHGVGRERRGCAAGSDRVRRVFVLSAGVDE